MPSIRLCFILLTTIAGSAILIGLVMQYQFGMEPCPLCISQRIFIILTGLSALLGALLWRSSLATRINAGLGVLFCLIGGSISARHVWIQNLPEDEVPICGPGLSYMFETRPIFDALGLLFAGDGHCAEVSFKLLGLSIPAWTFLLFVGMALSMAWICLRSFRGRSSRV